MTESILKKTTLRNVFRTLLRHKHKMIGFFCITMTIVVLAVIFIPRKYESEAKLFVRIGRESLSIDPTATTGQTISINDPGESEIKSVLEILKSRDLLETVVDQIGAEQILEDVDIDTNGDPTPWQQLKSEVKHLANKMIEPFLMLDPVSDRQRAIAELEKTVSITATKKARVVLVYATSYSPEMAQRIVDTLIKAFRTAHVRMYRTAGSYEFFENQTRQFDQELKQSLNELKELKNKMGLLTVDSQQKILEEKLKTIQVDRIKIEGRLAQSDGRLSPLRQQLASIPDRLPTDVVKGFENMGTGQMRRELFLEKIQLQQLMAKYTEDHPFVQAKKNTVSGSEKIVKGEDQTRIQETLTINPIHQQLSLELAQEEAAVRALQSYRDQLNQQNNEVITELKQLNTNQVQLALLEEKISLLRDNYHNYAVKLEESRVDQALAQEKISNVNVAQAATFVEKPASPKKGLILLLGFFAAAFGAVGFALACEYLDDSFSTASEVEESLHVPVLLSIPRVSPRNALMN